MLRLQRRSAMWISSARDAWPQWPSRSSIVASRCRTVLTWIRRRCAVVLAFWLQSK